MAKNCPKKLAEQLANSSRHPKFKLGAVLEKDGQIVIAKANLPAFDGCKGMCAETRILRNPPRMGIRGCTLYVARVWQSNGQLSMARPCHVCMRWLKAREVSVIHYTDTSGQWVREYVN